jgi:hypothetical protein
VYIGVYRYISVYIVTYRYTSVYARSHARLRPVTDRYISVYIGVYRYISVYIVYARSDARLRPVAYDVFSSRYDVCAGVWVGPYHVAIQIPVL